MSESASNSPEMLCQEILADARRQSEEIVRRARQEAELLLTKAAAEADQLRRHRLEQARAEAARRAELILATVPVEAVRLQSDRVEVLLGSVLAEVRARLRAREGFDYREAIIGMAAEAINGMAGSEFTLQLSAADRARLGEGLAEEIVHRAGRSPLKLTVSEAAGPDGGGVVISDAEGRQVWDNGLEARLARLWPDLRRQVASQTGLVAPAGSTGSDV